MSTLTTEQPETSPSVDTDCSLARLRAMAKHCRSRGGDCDCYGATCKAVTAASQRLCGLIGQKQDVDRGIRNTEAILKRVQSPMATLRDGFKFREGLTPVIVFDGDDATFGYEDKDGEWVECNEWPFNESFVWADDCERHGIRVE